MPQIGGMKGSYWYTINAGWQQSRLVSLVSLTDSFCLFHTHTLVQTHRHNAGEISIKFTVALLPHNPPRSPPVDRRLLLLCADLQAVLIQRSSWVPAEVAPTPLHILLLIHTFILSFCLHTHFDKFGVHNRGGWATGQKLILLPDGAASGVWGCESVCFTFFFKFSTSLLFDPTTALVFRSLMGRTTHDFVARPGMKALHCMCVL